MNPSNPKFLPDPSCSRAEMETLQREVAAAARFANEFEFDPAAVSATPTLAGSGDEPIVLGVDQAFLGERVVGAVVALRGGAVVERAHAVTECEFPYIPGLLSFREAGAIVAALGNLDIDPDLAVFDGSGRIHYREAGLATHLGVLFDLPSIGVAKGLLCGTPESSTEDLPVGARVAIAPDGRIETAEDTDETIGYALQTRQYDSGTRRINPVYVSPGHRVGCTTAADLIERLCDGYKLPEPTRLADSYADEAKREIARTRNDGS